MLLYCHRARLSIGSVDLSLSIPTVPQDQRRIPSREKGQDRWQCQATKDGVHTSVFFFWNSEDYIILSLSRSPQPLINYCLWTTLFSPSSSSKPPEVKGASSMYACLISMYFLVRVMFPPWDMAISRSIAMTKWVPVTGMTARPSCRSRGSHSTKFGLSLTTHLFWHRE